MYGLRYSMGVFFTPLQQEFGWTTATTASAVTVFFWVYALAAPLTIIAAPPLDPESRLSST